MPEQLTLFDIPKVEVKTEVQKREDVLVALERSRLRKVELERRRTAARHLVYENKYGHRHNVRYSVCSDDWNRYLGIRKEVRPSKMSTANNINGVVCRGKEWAWIGEYTSQREGGHGNIIGLWTLKQYEKEAREDFERAYGK